MNRWSLSAVVAAAGALGVGALALPMGLYLMWSASAAVESSLAARGCGLAATLSSQITEPMLTEDAVGLHAALERARDSDEAVRYICVEDRHGRIAAHTFDGAFPLDLQRFWRRGLPRPTGAPIAVRFRGRGEPMLEVVAPILSGQLGLLHVGLSRAEARAAARRVQWALGIGLGVAFASVLVGSQALGARVTRPLLRLEREVSRLPDAALLAHALPAAERPRAPVPGDGAVSGVREVETLARGFLDLRRRLHALEQERATTLQRMVHAERLAAVGEVAAGLAHEICNPLDGMLECMRYLEADPDKSARAAKYYPLLKDGLERIARTMRGMLGFARSGRQMVVEECRVAEVTEGLALLVRDHLRGRQVEMHWSPAGRCECLADRDALAQALLNLVLNAADAAESHERPQVRVAARCDGQWVYLTVDDNGPGVPPELRRRIFEPFFTTKPSGRGTGLGLTVSRQLLRAAGGELEVADEPSPLGGARFIVRLPRVVREAPSLGEKSSNG